MQTWLRRILALVALVGSFTGLTAAVPNIMALNSGGGSFVNLGLAVLGVIFFIYGIMCGFWLLERRTGAVLANVIFWLLQLPVVVTSMLTWKISTLAFLNMTTDPAFSLFGVGMGSGSSFSLALDTSPEDLSIGFNMFALLMIILLTVVGIGTRRESGLLSGAKKVAAVAGGAAAATGAAVAMGAKGAATVAGAAGDVAGKAADVAGSAVSGAIDMAGDIAEATGSLASGVAEGAGTVAEGTLDAAKTTASAAGDLAEKTVDVAGAAVSGAADMAANVAESSIEAAKSTASAAGDLASGAADMAGGAVDTVVEAASIEEAPTPVETAEAVVSPAPVAEEVPAVEIVEDNIEAATEIPPLDISEVTETAVPLTESTPEDVENAIDSLKEAVVGTVEGITENEKS